VRIHTLRALTGNCFKISFLYPFYTSLQWELCERKRERAKRFENLWKILWKNYLRNFFTWMKVMNEILQIESKIVCKRENFLSLSLSSPWKMFCDYEKFSFLSISRDTEIFITIFFIIAIERDCCCRRVCVELKYDKLEMKMKREFEFLFSRENVI
jgi:hypothetical protein